MNCAANAMNMLEGFNGLSAGMGLIMVSSLIIISFVNGMNSNRESLQLLIPLFGSLLAFLYFNVYPARVFPGDSLTLVLGATICCASLESLKFEGFILMLPMIVEFFLKLRGNFKGQCFAQSLDGNILIYKGRTESLTHFVMKNFSVDEKNWFTYFGV